MADELSYDEAIALLLREFGGTGGKAESRLQYAVNREGVRVRLNGAWYSASTPRANIAASELPPWARSFPWQKAKYNASDLNEWIGQERERLKRIEALEHIEGNRKEDTERSSVDADQTRTPDRTAARQALTDLYPGGMPSAVMVPNKNLCTAVRKKLPADREMNISDDTILRAAGRRRG